MNQPGVEVRPLIQMTGESGFSEVFFTNARVPADAIIGEFNGGWGVALSTLGFERTSLGTATGLGFRLTAPGGSRFLAQQEVSVGEFITASKANARSYGVGGTAMTAGGIVPLVALARELGRDHDPEVRQQVVRLYTLASANTWNGLRASAAQRAGGRAGPEASLGKLMASRIGRQWRDTASLVAGPHGMLAGEDGPLGGRLAMQMLATPGPSIYGGSDQIQRNIIGERVLGLPKEPDPYRALPFRELKVGTQAAQSQAAGAGEAS